MYPFVLHNGKVKSESTLRVIAMVLFGALTETSTYEELLARPLAIRFGLQNPRHPKSTASHQTQSSWIQPNLSPALAVSNGCLTGSNSKEPQDHRDNVILQAWYPGESIGWLLQSRAGITV